jgi:hypothetical protein
VSSPTSWLLYKVLDFSEELFLDLGLCFGSCVDPSILENKFLVRLRLGIDLGKYFNHFEDARRTPRNAKSTDF